MAEPIELHGETLEEQLAEVIELVEARENIPSLNPEGIISIQRTWQVVGNAHISSIQLTITYNRIINEKGRPELIAKEYLQDQNP